MKGRRAKTNHNSQSKERKITQEAKGKSKIKTCKLPEAWENAIQIALGDTFAAPDCFEGGVSIRDERQREGKNNH